MELKHLVIMSDNISSSRQFPLLRLPPEVRMMIYDLLWYPSDDRYKRGQRFTKENHFPPALSSVCEEIAQECLPSYFGKCRLRLYLDINSSPRSGERKELLGQGHVGTLDLVTPGRDATLAPEDQIKYSDMLSSIKEMYFNVSCDEPSFYDEYGGRLRRARKGGKYHVICCIQINLGRTSASHLPPVIVGMGDYTCEGGEASIEGNEPWVKGDPEYEWGMALPEKIEALLAAQPQPVRYSGDLMKAILNAMRDLQLSFSGFGDRILDGKCYGAYIRGFSKSPSPGPYRESDYEPYDVDEWLIDEDCTEGFEDSLYDSSDNGIDDGPGGNSGSDDFTDDEAAGSDSLQVEGSSEDSLQSESEASDSAESEQAE